MKARMFLPANTPVEIHGITDELVADATWIISRVRASVNPHRFEVWLSNVTKWWRCPVCEARAYMLGERGRTRTRVFRWLKSETETLVYFRLPIVECPEHGRYQVPLRCVENAANWRFVHTLAPDEPA